MLHHGKEHNTSNEAMTTTDTPRWTVTQFNSALLEHDGETCNEIFCISKDEAECLVDLLNELTERAERLRSTMRSFILVSPIEAQRMEKIEAEAERFRELLLRAINEIEKTPFHTPKLTAFTAHRLADRYREKMTNDSRNTQNTQEDDK